MGILRERYNEFEPVGILRHQPLNASWRVGGDWKEGTATDWGSTKVSTKPTCATHGTGKNRCGVYPDCKPCDDDPIVTNGGDCLSHQIKNPITGECEDRVSEKCPRPGERWNGYKCVKDERVINTPVGDVNVSGTLYGMDDAKDIYDLDRNYMANYSGLYSSGAGLNADQLAAGRYPPGYNRSGGIFTEGPYALEGAEKSMSGFNQIGQPWGLSFIDRIGQQRPLDWSPTDEDAYVMGMTDQDYIRYKIDPLCEEDCKETVVNLGHLTPDERVEFKRKALAGELPGQVDPRTGRKTSSVGTSILDPVGEAVAEDDSLLSAASSGRGGSGGGGEERAPTTQTEKIKASKVKRNKTVKTVAKKANTTTKIASDAVSRARGDTALATRIAKMTKDFTAAKKKDDSVYMPTFRKGPSGGWLGGL